MEFNLLVVAKSYLPACNMENEKNKRHQGKFCGIRFY